MSDFRDQLKALQTKMVEDKRKPEPQQKHVEPTNASRAASHSAPKVKVADHPTQPPPDHATNSSSPTKVGVAGRIAGIRTKIGLAKAQAPGLVTVLSDLDNQLAALREELDRNPDVTISLIGGTGAGKSTLLNALVGARLLPVSNMKACTAAVSEVSWSEGEEYRATVEFVPRKAWLKEVELLKQDIADFERTTIDDGEGNGESGPGSAPARAARDKLRTVYAPRDGEGNVGDVDLSRLVEPREIRDALDQQQLTFQERSLETFQKRIKEYLDSKHRFWPIVKRVRLSGPFEPLRNGVRLVDLPGLNDPNEAREQVTREHIKTCRFVWIVFNIKRVLTKSDINILVSDDFVRQVIMDGRANALTLVATASDDIDLDSALDEFGLDEDAEERDAILARNQRIRKVIDEQLGDLAYRFSTVAGELERAADLQRTFRGSRVFTTSAKEFLVLTGLSKAKNGKLSHEDETELPALITHMNAISSGFGVDAHVASIGRRADLIRQQLAEELQARKVVLSQLRSTSEAQRKEVKRAAKDAHRFLDEKTKALSGILVARMDGHQKVLRQRFETASLQAKLQLDSTIRRWSQMHWATMRAVSRRGGVFTGSSGKHDFPEDVCRPILNAIAFAWADFFGSQVGDTTEMAMKELLLAAQDFKVRLLEELTKIPNLPPEVRDSLNTLLATTERILTEQIGQIRAEIDGRIQRDRRTLYEGITREVGANMGDAFSSAATESGSGMKQRMVGTIDGAARSVSEELMVGAIDQAFAGVRSLLDWLGKKHGEMAETVVRQGAMAEENLTRLEDLGAVARLEREVMLLEGLLEDRDEKS
jgi:energy-coupling factor transporter ATP-binding protein EcfA2